MAATVQQQKISPRGARNGAAALRRRSMAGQSLIVAIIVLFLLLVLGAAFIALVANNIRNTRNAVRRVSADAYAEAGIRYMDEQLTNAPEGADWRPRPECFPGKFPCVDIAGNAKAATQNDPDWDWIKPYDATTGTGGFTRINYGGDTPGSPGGRALIRVTYSPDIATVINEKTVLVDPRTQTTDDSANAEAKKYIKLESIGRVGVVDTGDPTTYNNTDAASLRREMVAYKQIGLTDYLRFITNKDNKPSPATLGAAIQVLDANATDPAGGTFTNPPPQLGTFDIPSYYIGSIRSNASLTFHGYNSLYLDPNRGDALQVAGQINLANDAPNVGGTEEGAPSYPAANVIQGNPARVFINDLTTNTAIDTNPVYPSTSTGFNTYKGFVRDNPAGGNTQGLPDQSKQPNLRSVPRATAPLLDAPGANGVTRYRSLTRDSAPMDQNSTGGVNITAANPGSFGWGQYLYLNNTGDVQRPSSLVNLYSLRTDWLNPGGGYWKGDTQYVPPGVTITLTPRYMVLTRTGDQVPSSTNFTDRFRFSDQNGNRIQNTTIIRYTVDAGGGVAMQNPPFKGTATTGVGETVGDDAKFAGYPATAVNNASVKYYNGNFIIYAEGNVRIRGVIGGLDPETQQYFLRHLTVVSGGTIYIDGNILRDNIPANATDATAKFVRGQSSIALLAHDYVAVNTTQFMKPFSGEKQFNTSQGNENAVYLEGGQQFPFTYEAGPIDADNTPPSAVNGYTQPSIYMRHESGGDGTASISLTINGALYNNFPTPPPSQPTPSILQLNNNDANPAFNDDVFVLTPSLLYPNATSPAAFPELGSSNQFAIENDASAAGQTNGQQYDLSRLGVSPRDVRIEAILYAQEGSFFIIPGPWFNPNPNDTYASYIGPDPANPNSQYLHRPENTSKTNPPTDPNNDPNPAADTIKTRVDPMYPFYGQPQDIRITFYGSITENMTAELGDQTAWLQKWGWVPRYQGSTGLPTNANYGDPSNNAIVTTVHGPLSQAKNPANNAPLYEYTYRAYNGAPGVAVGTVQEPAGGIIYEYDPRGSSPYIRDPANPNNVTPIRPNPYRPTEPLPLTPGLPVEPGLLYVGDQPVQP